MYFCLIQFTFYKGYEIKLTLRMYIVRLIKFQSKSNDERSQGNRLLIKTFFFG